MPIFSSKKAGANGNQIFKLADGRRRTMSTDSITSINSGTVSEVTEAADVAAVDLADTRRPSLAGRRPSLAGRRPSVTGRQKKSDGIWSASDGPSPVSSPDRSPEPGKRRGSVSAPVGWGRDQELLGPAAIGSPSASKAVSHEKLPTVRTLLEATTSTHVLFSGLLSESEGSEGVEALRQLVDAFYPMDCKEGQMVMEQGTAGDWFAVVESGCFIAMTMGGWQQAPDGSGKQVTQREKYSTPGDSFGELAMLYDCPRAATITTQSAGRLWVLERSSLQQLAAKISGKEYRSVGIPEFMRGLDVFGSLSDDQRNDIANAASVELYEPRTTVFEAGEEASALFCVMQGEAHVLSAQGEQLLRF